MKQFGATLLFASALFAIGSNAANIEIKNADGVHSWWYGCEIYNIDSSVQLSAVYVSSTDIDTEIESDYDWTLGQKQDWYYPYPWFFYFQSEHQIPLHIKLVSSNDETLIAYNLITNFNGGASFDFGTNFVSSGSNNGGTSGSGSGSESGLDTGLGIKAEDGCHSWWYGLTLTNMPSDIKIKQVYLRNSDAIYSDNQWLLGKAQWWNENTWFFDFGTTGHEWQLPFDIKVISTDNQEITQNDVITSNDYGSIFYCDDNFVSRGDTQTDTVTDTDTETGASGYVTVTANRDCSIYWYGITLGGYDDNKYSISHIYLKNSKNYWVEGVKQWYDKNVYHFDFYSEWSLPYTIKIVASNGKTIIKDDLIDSYTYGTIFNTKDTFDW